MAYLTAGVSGLTGVVGTFSVRGHLGLSAEFLAAQGFCAVIPLDAEDTRQPSDGLDLALQRHPGLSGGHTHLCPADHHHPCVLARPEALGALMPVPAWYILSVLLVRRANVIQDVVADAMTVDAVPTVDPQGNPFAPESSRRMHPTMQTLVRVTISGGSVFVALLKVFLFQGAEAIDEAQEPATHIRI